MVFCVFSYLYVDLSLSLCLRNKSRIKQKVESEFDLLLTVTIYLTEMWKAAVSQTEPTEQWTGWQHIQLQEKLPSTWSQFVGSAKMQLITPV